MQQVRDLEKQLNQSTQRRQISVLSEEEEFLDFGDLLKSPSQDRNLSHIRAINKEKREAFEVCINICKWDLINFNMNLSVYRGHNLLTLLYRGSWWTMRPS